MGSLIRWMIYVTWSTIILGESRAIECPRKYKLTVIEQRDRCIDSFIKKSFVTRSSFCRERLSVEGLLAADKRLEQIREVTKIWVDSRRAYEDGPFVDWRLQSDTIGEPIMAPELWEANAVTRPTGDCLAFNVARKTYEVASCSSKQDMICLADPYEFAPEREGCHEGYYYFASPAPVCLTKRQSSYTETRSDLSKFCRETNGTLVMDGYIHTKNPFLTDNDTQKSALPTDIRVINGTLRCGTSQCFVNFFAEVINVFKNKSKWNLHLMIQDNDNYYLEEDKEQKYSHFFCEHRISKTDRLIITAMNDTLLVSSEGGMEMDKVLCFTNSETYYPTIVDTYPINGSALILRTTSNGMFWCLNNNSENLVEESDTILWISNQKLAKDLEVVFVRLPPYTWDSDDIQTLKIRYYPHIREKMEEHWEENIRKVINKLYPSNISPFYTYKVFTDGSLLLLLDSGELALDMSNAVDEDPDQNFVFVYPKDRRNCLDDYVWKYSVKKKNIDDNNYILSKTLMRDCSDTTHSSIKVTTPSTRDTVGTTKENPSYSRTSTMKSIALTDTLESKTSDINKETISTDNSTPTISNTDFGEKSDYEVSSTVPVHVTKPINTTTPPTIEKLKETISVKSENTRKTTEPNKMSKWVSLMNLLSGDEELFSQLNGALPELSKKQNYKQKRKIVVFTETKRNVVILNEYK